MYYVNVVNIHGQITVASYTYIIRVIINRLDFSIVQRLQSTQNCFFLYRIHELELISLHSIKISRLD